MILHHGLFVTWFVCSWICVTSADDWVSSCLANSCRCVGIESFKVAYCGHPSRTSIPTGLNSSLDTLVLSNSFLPSFPAKAFSSVRLTNLKIILCRECHLEEIDKEAFSGLSDLYHVDLSQNRINTLSPGTFQQIPNLKYVYLDENPLETLADGLFTNFTSLRRVSLVGCKINQIGTKVFGQVPRLFFINLAENQLTHLNFSIVGSMPGLHLLALHGNPWQCDCQLKQLRVWYNFRHNYEVFHKTPSCAEPRKLRGWEWDQINPNDFTC